MYKECDKKILCDGKFEAYQKWEDGQAVSYLIKLADETGLISDPQPVCEGDPEWDAYQAELAMCVQGSSNGSGPVTTVTGEFVCNPTTGMLDYYEVTTIDGVSSEPVITPTSNPCIPQTETIEIESEFICNAATGFFDFSVITITNGVPGDPVVTPTEMLCVGVDPPSVSIDAELICNASGFYDLITFRTVNGVTEPYLGETTSLPCHTPPDFEQTRQCRDGFVYIVTNQINSDGTITELSAVSTPEQCERQLKYVETKLCSEDGEVIRVVCWEVHDPENTANTKWILPNGSITTTEPTNLIPCEDKPQLLINCAN